MRMINKNFKFMTETLFIFIILAIILFPIIKILTGIFIVYLRIFLGKPSWVYLKKERLLVDLNSDVLFVHSVKKSNYENLKNFFLLEMFYFNKKFSRGKIDFLKAKNIHLESYQDIDLENFITFLNSNTIKSKNKRNNIYQTLMIFEKLINENKINKEEKLINFINQLKSLLS